MFCKETLVQGKKNKKTIVQIILFQGLCLMILLNYIFAPIKKETTSFNKYSKNIEQEM